MRVSEIVSELQSAKQLVGCSTDLLNDVDISLVTTDSRDANSAGHLFIAYKGVSVDGHSFLESCYQSGVRLFVVETTPTQRHADALYLTVKCARHAWSYICALQFGHPERKLTFCAVTGTNGKTSTAWFVHHLLTKLNFRSAYIGTLGILAHGQLTPAKHTTPDPPDLFATLAKFAASGIKFVCMEASSQSIVHGRLGPIRFVAAGFTSFSHDHLDTHGTMENYLHAKLSLFEDYLLPHAWTFACDKLRSVLRDTIFFKDERFKKNFAWYGLISADKDGDVVSCEVSSRRVSGCDIEVNFRGTKKKAPVGIVGDVFVENFVCALLLAQKIADSDIPSSIWREIPLVPGRCEVIQSKSRNDRPTVIVDYAHTPDGLENVLQNLRAFCANKLICVFGCGGDRDPLKRPLMGAIAARLADFVFVTSDNPRTESPDEIIAQIVAGISPADLKTKVAVEVGREAAIARAVATAQKNDLILIAGKGHEDYQIIGKEKLPFDDRLIALAELSK